MASISLWYYRSPEPLMVNDNIFQMIFMIYNEINGNIIYNSFQLTFKSTEKKLRRFLSISLGVTISLSGGKWKSQWLRYKSLSANYQDQPKYPLKVPYPEQTNSVGWYNSHVILAIKIPRNSLILSWYYGNRIQTRPNTNNAYYEEHPLTSKIHYENIKKE